ncbi:hypothetical protein D041_4094A, partial [Vibrio parahaemolyticus EKP-008]
MLRKHRLGKPQKH